MKALKKEKKIDHFCAATSTLDVLEIPLLYSDLEQPCLKVWALKGVTPSE